jgi:PadR family transcriptional regulator, regulatory protein AphA
MSVRNAILGYLSWRPLTGYDLKKLFADSDLLHWSGNSNQIYTALVQLRRDGLLTSETEQQDSRPPRKTYSLTASGREALRSWVLSRPELPELHSTFLVQLGWADQLAASELDALVGQYESAVQVQLAVCREKIRRGNQSPDRTAREQYLWRMAHENRLRAWKAELGWARDLRSGLAEHRGSGRRRGKR